MLLAYVLTFALSIAVRVGELGVPISPLLASAHGSERSAFDAQPLGLMVAEGILFILLAVANLVGLYRLRHWARILGLHDGLDAAARDVMGPFLSTGFEWAPGGLSTALWGGLLALSFYGPGSAQFAPDVQGGSKADP